jgi:hypothetical protein
LTDRYRERLAGVLSCYDPIIITGTLPGACYAKGMTAFLWARQIRIFDYPRFAEPLRNRVRDRAAELASAAGVTIEHIAKSHIRKGTSSARSLPCVATIPAWCISSRRWKPVTATSPGTTNALPHPALGQDLTPSPTTGHGRAVSGVRAGSARRGARVDSSRPCVIAPSCGRTAANACIITSTSSTPSWA